MVSGICKTLSMVKYFGWLVAVWIGASALGMGDYLVFD